MNFKDSHFNYGLLLANSTHRSRKLRPLQVLFR